MSTSIPDEMKSYIGFGDRDAGQLRALAEPVGPHLPAVVERFYREILRRPGARSVLAGGETQVARLRGHLLNWLRTLFCGQYDALYFQQREAIGLVHVRVGLPQHYMFTGMEIVWQELSRVVRAAGLPDADGKLVSLHKLLTLETGMMLESYRAAYSERVRQAEQEMMRERVTRVERLAEVGRLAASLAHEIKNPLAGISGAIQVIREDLAPGDTHREVLDQILRQINRLDGTVKDLLTYARPQAPRFKLCDMSGVIERVMTLLSKEPAFAEIRLECDDCATFEPLELDEHQVEQLLMNLLLNAAHASTAGASVQLRIGSQKEETTLVVQDHGHGMDPETQKRAFEPFFTTKARGTGLGLSICQRIVDAHGGLIAIRSRPGQGTMVEVRLPRSQSFRRAERNHDDTRSDR